MGNLDGARAEEGQRKASRSTNGLLASSDETVQAPFVKGELLGGDGAHAVANDESLGGHALDNLSQALEIKQHTGRGVDVCGGNDLVLLLGQGLFNFVKGRTAADGTGELGHVGAVLLKAVCKTVTKVASCQNKGIFASLDQIGGDEIPAKRAGAVDDVGLGVGVGGFDDLAEETKSLTKGLDETGADVALAVGQGGQLIWIVPFCRSNWTSSTAAAAVSPVYDVPVVAHGAEDLIVKLNGTGNQKRGVRSLERHVGLLADLTLEKTGRSGNGKSKMLFLDKL